MPNPRKLDTIVLAAAILAAAVFLTGAILALADCMTGVTKGMLIASAPVLVVCGAVYVARR
ncbi:MAG: hypothetical protein ABFD92_16185 [Planctomycetaceae bacterium]|nr:hypothetical protein [Planctomycetaceae bacterium]